jgi:DNA repair protein RadC
MPEKEREKQAGRKPPKQPSYLGHRERMHERVRTQGLESLPEYEALEYLLYFAMARADTKPLAKALLARFGSLSAVLDAPEQDLLTVEGVGPKTAQLLHLIPQYQRYYVRSRAAEERKMDTTERRGRYLMAQFYAMRQERMMLLELNDKHQLIKSVWIDSGTTNSVDADLHKIAAEAVRSGASAVVLAHNHPGGVALPSREDIYATGNIMRVLGVLGIHVLDHIIVTEDEYFSMWEEKRLPFYNFRTGELTYFG